MTSSILRKNYTVEIVDSPKPCCGIFGCWKRQSKETVIHFSRNYDDQVQKTTDVYQKRKSSDVAHGYYEKKKEENARQDLEEIENV